MSFKYRQIWIIVSFFLILVIGTILGLDVKPAVMDGVNTSINLLTIDVMYTSFLTLLNIFGSLFFGRRY